MRKNNVLITGGATGLGRVISLHLAKQGNNVYVLDRISFKKVDFTLANKIYRYIQIDLEEVSNMEMLRDILPEDKINVLINNASLREFNEFNKFNWSKIKKNIHVNLIVPILLTKYFLNIMLDENYGRVVNISSKSGFWGYSSGSIYCTTKSALIKFTESLSKELRTLNKNVTANVICPDSFSDTTGKQLKNYNYVISSTLNALDRIIETNVNGKCFTSISLFEKIINIIKYARQQIRG